MCLLDLCVTLSILPYTQLLLTILISLEVLPKLLLGALDGLLYFSMHKLSFPGICRSVGPYSLHEQWLELFLTQEWIRWDRDPQAAPMTDQKVAVSVSFTGLRELETRLKHRLDQKLPCERNGARVNKMPPKFLPFGRWMFLFSFLFPLNFYFILVYGWFTMLC